MGVEVVVIGPQKALAGPSGVSLVAVSESAWAVMAANERAPRHSSLSLLDWKDSWLETDRSTLPVILAPLEIRSLAQASERVLEEGLENVCARHRGAARAAREGGRVLGLEPFVTDEDAAVIVTTFHAPDARDAREIVRALAGRELALSAGVGELAPIVLRVDHTGQRARLEVVVAVLIALAEVLEVSERAKAAIESATEAWEESLAGR